MTFALLFDFWFVGGLLLMFGFGQVNAHHMTSLAPIYNIVHPLKLCHMTQRNHSKTISTVTSK